MKALIATVVVMIVTQTAFAGMGVQTTNCKSKSGKTRIEIRIEDGGGTEMKLTLKGANGKDIVKNWINDASLLEYVDAKLKSVTTVAPINQLLRPHVVAVLISESSAGFNSLELVSKPGVKFVKGPYGSEKATFKAELSGVDPRNSELLKPIELACAYEYSF